MHTIKIVNLALRFLLELTALASLGYGGWQLPDSVAAKIAMAVSIPFTAAVLWSLWVSPQAPYDSTPLRLLVELAVFGGAAYALARFSSTPAAATLLLVYATNRALMTIWDQ